MAIDFPTAPSTGQQHTSGGRTWEFDSVAWLSVTLIQTRGREDIAGTKDSANTAFTITTGGSAVDVFKNGLLLKETVGYTISGTAITALSGYIPNSGDVYEAVIYP